MPLLEFHWSRRSIFSGLAFIAMLILFSDNASAQLLESPGRIWSIHGEQSYCPDQRFRLSTVKVHDVQNGFELQALAFPDSSGNSAQVLTGLAFDTTRRVVWYTLNVPTCTTPGAGDGFIYRRTASGSGPVTTIPAPGGAGGPGISSLDYDPEEDVLWAAVLQPINGQSVFYKINPTNGNVLKTISIAATLTSQGVPQPNDTLAIARPADLNGAKVLLTDAGLNQTPALYAVDVNNGAILKSYPIQNLGRIKVDLDTGDLLFGNSTLTGYVINDIGPAPYTSFGKGSLNIQDDFSAPVFTLRDFAIEPLTCDDPTIPRPAPETINNQHGWSMRVEVTDRDGLVVRDVRLGHRYMAEQISVPYYTLQTSAFPLQRAELKPDSNDASARSRLVNYYVTSDVEKVVIEATYIVDRIPAASRSCLHITQRYEFYDSNGGACEPSATLPCSRFKPVVKYAFLGKNRETLQSINIVQRHHFQVDGTSRNAAATFRDCDDAPSASCFATSGNPVFEKSINPILTEMFSPVIRNGQDLHAWDNFHQTRMNTIDEPGFDILHLRRKPGCPECVHVHWRWGASLGAEFGGGSLLIPLGSHQDLDFAVVRYHSGEEHPDNYIGLLDNHEAIAHAFTVSEDPIIRSYDPEDVVFYYAATGHQVQDAFFIHNGFFNPAFGNVTHHAGAVDVTFQNVFMTGQTTADPIDPASVGTLPPGYIAYNNLAYNVATDAIVSGPYRFAVNIPRPNDPTLIPNLRILHSEFGSLVDRTDQQMIPASSRFRVNIVIPPGPSPTISLTATVESLGKFVVAVQFDRAPVVRCKDVTLTADNSCAASITAGDIDDGSSDPDGDTVTLTVDSTGPFSPGQHTVTLTASDNHGVSSSCTATVTVEDRTPPSITACASDKTLSANSTGQAAIPNLTSEVSATDGCTASSGLNISQSPAAGTLVGLGVTTVTITVMDTASNRATCITNVTVVDTTPPVITTCAVPLTAAAGSNCQTAIPDVTGAVSATDNCTAPGALAVTQSPAAGTLVGPGSTAVTITVKDGAGNQATCATTVAVIDSTPPVITSCPAPITTTAGSNCQAAVPNVITAVSATDNCTSPSALTVTQNPAAGTPVGIGATTITITVKDAANNSSTCTTSFTVNGSPLTALGTARVWIGLKNSDDVGTKFDLLAEVLKNGAVVGSGQINDVTGGSSGFNNAVLDTINLAMSAPLSLCSGDSLGIRLSVRVAATSGHVSGTARLWFNDSAANSRFGATVGGVTGDYFLLDGFALNVAAGTGPRRTIDVTVNRNVGGNPFKPFGTWSKSF